MTDLPDRPIFLLTGFASEYSLRDLAKLLRSEGETVIEIDFSTNRIPDVGNAKIIMITSLHPARTSWIFKRCYGLGEEYTHYLSPMECMERLNICCSIFVPHDLEQPVITDEIAYLSLFDFYCSPYEFNPGMSLICQTLYTGWVKYVDITSEDFAHIALAERNGVFFVNQLIELGRHGGIPYLLKEYAAYFEMEIPFKLPSWPGVSEMETQLRLAGAKVIPSETSSTQVIAASRQVYSNAAGSIMAEAAYLGIPRLIALPGSHPRLVTSAERRRDRHFDFQLLMNAIRNHLDETRYL